MTEKKLYTYETNITFSDNCSQIFPETQSPYQENGYWYIRTSGGNKYYFAEDFVKKVEVIKMEYKK